MNKLEQILGRIKPTDQALGTAARQHLDTLTKPQGSLGLLEKLAAQIVMIIGEHGPQFKNKVIFTLAADHGVARAGVSVYPPEVTAQMVLNFLQGGAAINVLAGQVGARVVVADLGVAADLDGHENLVDKKIAYGTQNMVEGAAMTRDEALRSVIAGIELFETELEKGADLVGVGEMGIGNTTAAAAICAVLTGEAVSGVTGRGTGVDDLGLVRKIRAIERALEVNRPDPSDALDVLHKVGGFEIGGMAGVMLAAAACRVPVIVDGFISAAAALIAQALSSRVTDYMIAGHCSVEAGHPAALHKLNLNPVLDLQLRLGEGTGAALAMYMVEAGVRIYAGMATFSDAGVSGKTI